MHKDLYLEQEDLITESDDRTITLTTHRIRYSTVQLGKSRITSILIDKVSAIEVHNKSLPGLLVAGLIIAVIGTANLLNRNSTAEMSLGIGGLLILAFFFTRQHVVSIAAVDGTKIHFRTKGMKQDSLLKFISQVEQVVVRNKKM